MRPQELVVAAVRDAGEPVAEAAPGELLSLIDAIEHKLVLVREAVNTMKLHVRAASAGGRASVQAGDHNDGVSPARPDRVSIGDAQRKD
jgi:hypothetical protein